MTSDMEMELDKIARGKSDGNDFLNNYKKLVAKYWIEDKNNKQRQPLKKRKSLLSFLRSFL